MNLVDILNREKIVSQSQMDEVLEYQKSFGGRLESHLYRLGYTNEESLVNALARQFSIPGITLAGKEIPNSIIQMIPAESARQLLALPVEYDREKNILRIACENPRDKNLYEQLHEINPDLNLEFIVALSPVLKCAILHYYRLSRESEISGNEAFNGSHEQSNETPVGKNPINCHIRIIDDGGDSLNTIQQMLSHQGYQIAVVDKSGIYENSEISQNADMLIISSSGTTEEISNLLDSLMQNDIDIINIPTILISDNLDNQTQATFLKGGIEEVISSDFIMDLLILRLNRIRDRLTKMKNHRREIIKDLGTHGTLIDMGVIELLQAMATTRKTARISISGDSQHLTVFLKHGNIIYAECDTLRGPEAVYRGITWNHGVWSVDPVDEKSLPEPNNQLSNEAVLLEGCRLMDENNHEIEFCDPDLSDIFG